MKPPTMADLDVAGLREQAREVLRLALANYNSTQDDGDDVTIWPDEEVPVIDAMLNFAIALDRLEVHAAEMRERGAKVAEEYTSDSYNPGVVHGATIAALNIAVAIRALPLSAAVDGDKPC